jgi:hypothetical protein
VIGGKTCGSRSLELQGRCGKFQSMGILFVVLVQMKFGMGTDETYLHIMYEMQHHNFEVISDEFNVLTF